MVNVTKISTELLQVMTVTLKSVSESNFQEKWEHYIQHRWK